MVRTLTQKSKLLTLVLGFAAGHSLFAVAIEPHNPPPQAGGNEGSSASSAPPAVKPRNDTSEVSSSSESSEFSEASEASSVSSGASSSQASSSSSAPSQSKSCVAASALIVLNDAYLDRVEAFLGDQGNASVDLQAKLQTELADLIALTGPASSDPYVQYLYADEFLREKLITKALSNYTKFFADKVKFAQKSDSSVSKAQDNLKKKYSQACLHPRK